MQLDAMFPPAVNGEAIRPAKEENPDRRNERCKQFVELISVAAKALAFA